MSDLASLMKVAPGTAAYMIGQDQAQGQAENALKQKQLAELINEIQIKNSQSQAMNPLLVQHQGLQNQGLEAGLPGIVADSRKKGYDADFTAATQPGAIEKANSDAATAVGKNKTLEQNRIAQGFVDMGPWLREIDPELGKRTLAAVGRLKELGLKEDTPQGQMFLHMISRLSPQELPDKLEDVGKQMIKNSPKYVEEMDKTNAQVAGHKDVANIQGKTQRDVQQMQIDAGKYDKSQAAKSEDQLIDSSRNAHERYQRLVDAATRAQQRGDSKAASNYMDRAAQVYPQAQAELNVGNAAKPDVSAGTRGRIPAVAPPAFTPPGVGGPAPTPVLGPAGAAPRKLPPNITKLSDAMAMYPGKSAGEVKAAIKRVYGVDLQ